MDTHTLRDVVIGKLRFQSGRIDYLRVLQLLLNACLMYDQSYPLRTD